ncbi:MAG: amidohydrolase family protein, partial [Deltaproteobacteria bacterium]|nr:amidohydrolase family protein [Deltaproteobacteria bacterium]
MEKYDLVIKGGLVIDPASDFEDGYNIGVREGKITTLTLNKIEGEKEIDASGLVISPGFIDVHSHVDGTNRAGEYSALMGVTTLIGGNCGTSHAVEGSDVGAFLERIDKDGFPTNHGFLIGASNLRETLGVDRYDPMEDEKIPRMVELVEEAISQGALGISFGLAYSPGTTEKELTALFRTAARHDVIVAVHPRYMGRGLPGFTLGAVAGEEELIEVAKNTGTRLQISHLGSQLGWKSRPYDAILTKGLETIESAREAGVDVTCDCHPYDAWCTAAGAAVLDHFQNPFLKEKFEKYQGVGISDIEVTSGPHKGKWLNEELFKQVRQEDPMTRVVGHMMQEDLVVRTLMNPYVMVASDCVYDDEGFPTHPRGVGTFARVLRRLVKERGVLTFKEALYKMTVQPAIRFGLDQKGRIAVGADADFTIFDFDTIEDLATYPEPDQE